MNHILLIAHTPLASALRAAALHVFPDAGAAITALDVQPGAAIEHTLAEAERALTQRPADEATLILTDVFGATPCNVAQRVTDGARTLLLVGANLPMVLRAVTYRQEPLPSMAQKALSGGMQGIMLVAGTAPQNQPRRATPHDQERDHHQQ
ncbi:PTS sugar transporter subunit IIA [Ottowia sp.]|uniref:PTS sugar transporter subunit IIA n=1 Tax=Ottowia sp. TaxID=1898956 RepID=UPI003A85C55E